MLVSCQLFQAIKAKYDVLISIDTYKTATARAALEAGSDILNDVWARLYSDGQMLALAAEKNAPIIPMHNQKKKYTMMSQKMSVHSSVNAYLGPPWEAGVAKDNIWMIQALDL